MDIKGLLKKVEQAEVELVKSNWGYEKEYWKEVINTTFKKKLDKVAGILKGVKEVQGEIVIAVDSDFDGYASAKNIYNLIKILGVPIGKVRIEPLSSLHKGVIETEKGSLVIITDVSFGNVKLKGEGTKLIWIDHHNINVLSQLKADSKLNGTGVLINCKLSPNQQVKNMSCGSFTYLICSILVDKLIEGNKERFTSNYQLTQSSEQDALLSLISDYCDLEGLRGFIKATYSSPKTVLYEGIKDRWSRDNAKHFKNYISIINNVIRMENHEILLQLIKEEEVGFHTVNEVQRLNDYKKTIIKDILRPVQPVMDNTGKGYSIRAYKVPMTTNPIMRNFKGLLASLQTPTEELEKGWATLSFHEDKGEVYGSFRTSFDKWFLEQIKKEVRFLEIGGHSKAFGFETTEDEFQKLLWLLSQTNPPERVGKEEGGFLKYSQLEEPKKSVESIAMYNEFSNSKIKVKFDDNDFLRVKLEERRTLYEVPDGQMGRMIITSFDLREKNEVTAIPVLRGNLNETENLDILEFN